MLSALQQLKFSPR